MKDIDLIQMEKKQKYLLKPFAMKMNALKIYFVLFFNLTFVFVSCLNPSENKEKKISHDSLRECKEFPDINIIFSEKDIAKEKCLYFTLFDEDCLLNTLLSDDDTIVRFFINKKSESSIIRFEKTQSCYFITTKKIPPMYNDMIFLTEENRAVSYEYFYRKINSKNWNTLLSRMHLIDDFAIEQQDIDGNSVFFEIKTSKEHKYGYSQYPLSPEMDTLINYVQKYVPRLQKDIYYPFFNDER